MELTIDTSSNRAGVALSDRGGTLALFAWHTASNHSRELLPNLNRLLQHWKVGLSSVDAIIVARGPGSFNGLRVGISTAKGLALVLGVPLLGIDTLEAEAYPFGFTGLPIRPVYRAGRDEIATALYRREADGWHCLDETRLTTINAVCRETKRKTIFCGEIPDDMMSGIVQKLGNKAMIPTSEYLLRTSALAALGHLRLSRGHEDDPVTLQPLYLRPPNITKPRQKTPPMIKPGAGRENRWKPPD